MADNSYTIEFTDFGKGFAPATHLNTLSEMGSPSQANEMTDCDVLANVLTQGPGLMELTNMDNLNEMMNFVMDVPPESGITYGIGDTKLYQITPSQIVYYPELIINGGFDEEADWTLNTGWSYNSGNVIHTGGIGESGGLIQNGTIDEGTNYRVSMEVGGTEGWVTVFLGTGDSSVIANGVGTSVFWGHWLSSTEKISIIPSENFDGTIDNVSIKIYPFPHTITSCTKGESVVFITTQEGE
jgi:hypothetical protein